MNPACRCFSAGLVCSVAVLSVRSFARLAVLSGPDLPRHPILSVVIGSCSPLLLLHPSLSCFQRLNSLPSHPLFLPVFHCIVYYLQSSSSASFCSSYSRIPRLCLRPVRSVAARQHFHSTPTALPLYQTTAFRPGSFNQCSIYLFSKTVPLPWIQLLDSIVPYSQQRMFGFACITLPRLFYHS